MKLRFPTKEIAHWASRYNYPRSMRNDFRNEISNQGYYTKSQLLEVCRWKTPRSAPRAELNDEEYIGAVSRVALASTNERLRIEVLTLLNGVSWPVASCLLHFGVNDTYPILDYRALWSLSVNAEYWNYKYPLWEEYVQTCRKISQQAEVSVRELDKALWQYSKENQPA